MAKNQSFYTDLKKIYKDLKGKEHIYMAKCSPEEAYTEDMTEEQLEAQAALSEAYSTLTDFLDEEFITEGRDDTTPRK